jgi:hypothetical protein
MPIGPILENQFGWRVEFQFKPTSLLRIMEAPSYGTIEEVVPPGDYLLEDGFIEVPAGRLVERIYMQPAATSNMIAGTTEGSDNLVLANTTPTLADDGQDTAVSLVCKIPTRIYFGGIISKTKIRIYTRRLP